MSSSSEKNNKKSNNLDKINPVDFIFKTMASRDPKKRKVKPISKSYDLLASDLLNDTSSDDEDYKPKEIDDDDDGDGDDDEDDDEDDDDDDVDKDDDGDDKSDGNQNGTGHPDDDLTSDLHNGIESNFVKFDLPSKVTKLLVCSVCLGDVSHEYDEIGLLKQALAINRLCFNCCFLLFIILVECDSCGITVHENCYGVTNDTEVDNESVHSNASSSSTEPWFCDSCLANVSSPSCDLCPNTGGIFKQTDVKRWVHLVCALYIPGVAFSDTTRLVGVTLFELPYFKWGSRVCSLCEDERLSRTGICISCDAGMCKSYFHVTCAQSHGLLSEAQNSEETELVDPFYAHCKVHASDKSGVKSKRRNWLALQSHIKIRKQQQDANISERIAKKLNKARVHWLSSEDLRSASWGMFKTFLTLIQSYNV
jgi:PREDICTED: similar to phd finger protein